MTLSSALIAVDRMSPVPLYYQVAQQLEQLIEAGELPPGTRLNNELVLAEQLAVSRPTVRRAIEYLVQRGYLVRKRGVVTRVVHPKMRRPVELTSLYDDLALSGKNPHTSVLMLETLPATDAVAHALGIDEGTPVVTLERLRYADGEPLAIMRNWIPSGLVELTPEPLERGGPLLTMQRTTYDDAGRSLEFASHLYRASHYSFAIVLVAS